MTTRYSRVGYKVPVTLIAVEPNVVVWQKEDRVLVGLGKKKKIKKTESAIAKATGYTPRYLKEIKVLQTENSQENQEKLKAGQQVTVAIFEEGDEVKVTGTTKGRGFAGAIKRHGFHGGPKTHGQSDRHRAPGSIGAGTTPGRVYKGKRMAGHMGASQFTVTNLEVIQVDASKNILAIKGAVPGAKNGFVIVEKTGKVKGYTPPPPPSEEKQVEKEEKAEAEAKEQKETKSADGLDQSKEKVAEAASPAEEKKDVENAG